MINCNGVYYEGEIDEGIAMGEGKLVNLGREFSYEGRWESDVPSGFGKEKWG